MELILPLNDAHFQARRSGMEIREPKDLVCESRNQIVKMCIKPTCPNTSLICDKKGCISCKSEDHKKCSKIDLEAITQSLNKHVPIKKQILDQVVQFDNKFITSLKETSFRLGKQIRFAGLDPKLRKVVEEIYQKKNARCLRGKEAAEFFDRIEEYEKTEPLTNGIIILLKEYKQILEKVMARSAKIKETLWTTLKPTAVSDIFNSKILRSSQEHAEVFSILNKDLDRLQKVEKLFTASEHDFSADAFHQKCDNKNNTIVLVQTEFGKVIGGFTHYPWQTNSGFINNKSRKSFIFSLDMKEKFVPQGDNKLIFGHQHCGPVFGGGSGSDINISDRCNKNKSFSDFPETYNREKGKKFTKNEQTHRLFAGDKEFKVIEYEVFQLFYE